jgi:hypothetical protein
MHPFLSPRLAVFIAIVSVAIWGAFALLVVVVGPSSKVSPMPTAAPAIDENVRVISLAVADALPVSTSKSDRLPGPLPAKPEPAKPEPAIKPAEPIDYAQADAEAEKKVRRAHAEAPDLCQRHGMHKVWTKDGKSWRCRR